MLLLVEVDVRVPHLGYHDTESHDELNFDGGFQFGRQQLRGRITEIGPQEWRASAVLRGRLWHRVIGTETFASEKEGLEWIHQVAATQGYARFPIIFERLQDAGRIRRIGIRCWR